MRQITSILFTFLILALICMSSCTPDGSSCNDEEAFCEFVNQDDMESTRSIIDDFLKKLPKDREQENLEVLRYWFTCMECVKDARIFCNSCMESLPPQSQLEVDVLVDGESKLVRVNVWMGDPMEAGGIHE